jgi:hypothetical protein
MQQMLTTRTNLIIPRACQGNSRDRAVFQASLSPVPIELRGTTDAPSRDKSLSDPRQPAF